MPNGNNAGIINVTPKLTSANLTYNADNGDETNYLLATFRTPQGFLENNMNISAGIWSMSLLPTVSSAFAESYYFNMSVYNFITDTTTPINPDATGITGSTVLSPNTHAIYNKYVPAFALQTTVDQLQFDIYINIIEGNILTFTFDPISISFLTTPLFIENAVSNWSSFPALYNVPFADTDINHVGFITADQDITSKRDIYATRFIYGTSNESQVIIGSTNGVDNLTNNTLTNGTIQIYNNNDSLQPSINITNESGVSGAFASFNIGTDTCSANIITKGANYVNLITNSGFLDLNDTLSISSGPGDIIISAAESLRFVYNDTLTKAISMNNKGAFAFDSSMLADGSTGVIEGSYGITGQIMVSQGAALPPKWDFMPSSVIITTENNGTPLMLAPNVVYIQTTLSHNGYYFPHYPIVGATYSLKIALVPTGNITSIDLGATWELAVPSSDIMIHLIENDGYISSINTPTIMVPTDSVSYAELTFLCVNIQETDIGNINHKYIHNYLIIQNINVVYNGGLG